MYVESLASFLSNINNINKSSKVYIWGTSIYGDLLGRVFNKKGIVWDGYYDNYDYMNNRELNFKPVYCGQQVNSSEKAVYVLTMRDYMEVQMQLLSVGIKDDNIFCFENASTFNELEDAVCESEMSIEEIKTFHNVRYGEECFIIGNGPSLNIRDLNLIHKLEMTSFASNLIFKCFDQTNWRPDYYFFIDVVGIREELENNEILKYISQNCKYMFGRSNGNLVKYKKQILNLLLFKTAFSKSNDMFDFSDDCSKQIYIGYTVTYAMLQMAVYMGFKKIYLLGMDHSFSVQKCADGSIEKDTSIKDHSDILGNYPMWGVADMIKTTKAYEAAKKYADQHEISIYNATRGGKLEVFERVDFDEFLIKKRKQV